MSVGACQISDPWTGALLLSRLLLGTPSTGITHWCVHWGVPCTFSHFRKGKGFLDLALVNKILLCSRIATATKLRSVFRSGEFGSTEGFIFIFENY